MLSCLITGVAEPIAIYGTFLGAFDAGLQAIILTDSIVASADPRTQKTIHDFSSQVFYPLLGAQVTSAQELKFIN